MTYSYLEFSRDLERIITQDNGVDYDHISDWAYKIRLDNIDDINPEVEDWLSHLELMSMDPQFEYSESELRDHIIIAKNKSKKN